MSTARPFLSDRNRPARPHCLISFSVWRGIFSVLIALSVHFTGLTASKSYAQPVLLRAEDAAHYLEAAPPGVTHLVIGRGFVLGDDSSRADTQIAYGSFARLLARLAVLKLIDQGEIRAEDPVHDLLPGLVEERVWEPVLTVAHLLSETAGFAVPTWYPGGPGTNLSDRTALKPYMSKARLPGRMHHDDPIASALLVQIVERITGQPYVAAVEALLGAPIGVGDTGLSMDTGSLYPAPFRPVLALRGSKTFLVKLVQSLLDRPSDRILTEQTASTLLFRPVWMFHPIRKGRTYGFTYEHRDGFRRLGLSAVHAGSALTPLALTLIPDRSIAFLAISERSGALIPQNALQVVLDAHVPRTRPYSQLITAAKAIRLPMAPSGFYVAETLPRSGLLERVSAVRYRTVFLAPEQDGSLTAGTTRYTPVSPGLYQSESGSQLTFSPIAAGGYMAIDGVVHRFIGPLGDTRLVLAPLPYALFILLSGGIYMAHRNSKRWRSMGRVAFLGPTLLCLGTWVEISALPYALYSAENPWLALVWRVPLNIGIMLTLSAAMHGIWFARSKTALPIGPLMLPMAVHLTLLTGAALIVFLSSVAWGLAGALWPLL